LENFYKKISPFSRKKDKFCKFKANNICVKKKSGEPMKPIEELTFTDK